MSTGCFLMTPHRTLINKLILLGRMLDWWLVVKVFFIRWSIRYLSYVDLSFSLIHDNCAFAVLCSYFNSYHFSKFLIFKYEVLFRLSLNMSFEIFVIWNAFAIFINHMFLKIKFQDENIRCRVRQTFMSWIWYRWIKFPSFLHSFVDYIGTKCLSE